MTFTATISPPTATGTVTFYDDVTILGSVPISQGQATLSTSLLAAGVHSIFAFYGGQTSEQLALTVRSLPDFGFQTSQTADVTPGEGTLEDATLVADFNGDGIPDLAITSTTITGGPVAETVTLTVMLGKGDGTFRTILTAPLTGPGLAVADFNGDGIPDIAVIGAIYLGKGDGTFQNLLPLDIPTTIPGGTVIATADFNGDGRADLVWESDVEAQTAGVVGVMLGNGDGTFQAAIETAIPYGGDLAVGDFNGDGRADLAVTNGSNGVYSTVSILLGNGDGTFQTPAVYQLPTLPASVRVGDFNGDGRSDIAILSQPNTSPNGMVSVMLSNSDGSLQPSVNTNVPGPVTGFVTGDFNGDGRLDIAVDEGTAEIATGQSLYILYGNGDGTMQAPVLQSTPLYDCLAAADFNRDGRTDLVGLHVPNSEATQALGVSLGQAAPQGSLTATAVLNAASYQPGIEAGSWVMILGTNLAASSRTWQASDFTGVALPTVVDGVSVTIDGNPAFVEYISSTQINVLAPGDNAIGPVNVVVTNNGQATVPAVAQLQTGAPGFFMTPSYNVAASVLPGYAAVTTAAPAEPGDLVVLWATGFGPTAPPTPAGTIVTGAPPTAALPVVTVGGMEVPVISSVLTPGTAGLYQITIQLPANVPTGTPVVQASIGAIETQPRATLIVGAH